MTARRFSSTKPVLGVACLMLLMGPVLAGCLQAAEVPGMRVGCDGPTGAVPTVPEVRGSYQRVDPSSRGQLPPTTDGIRIALLLPSADADIGRGVDLAVTQLTQAGADVRLTKRVVTTQDPVEIRAAFNATLKPEKPGVVISGLGDEATEALVETARDRRVPLLAAVAESQRLTSRYDTGGYLYRVPWADATEGRAAAELLWASGCRTANVITDGTDEGTAIANAFRSAFELKGGHVARVVALAEGAGNVAAAVDRAEVLQAGDRDEVPRPDAVLLVAGPSDAAAVLRKAYETRMSAHTAFFLTSKAHDPAFVTATGDDRHGHLLSEGLRGTSPMAAETRATRAFERAFLTAYGESPTNASARGYDATYLSVLASACARSDHPESMRQNLPIVNNLNDGDTDVSGADPLAAINTATGGCSVNYVGAAGDHDWNRWGEPVTGRFFLWTVAPDGNLRVTEPRVEPPALR